MIASNTSVSFLYCISCLCTQRVYLTIWTWNVRHRKYSFYTRWSSSQSYV